MNYMDFLQLAKTRRSVRKFTDEPVLVEDLYKICDAAHYAMSGGNSQPWEFLIVQNPETINKLRHVYAEGDFVWTYWLEKQRKEEYQHRIAAFPSEDIPQRAWAATEQLNAPAVICLLYDPRRQFGSVLAARADLLDGSRSVLSCSMGHISMLIQLAAASLDLGSCRVDSNQQDGYRKVLGYPEPLCLYCMVPIGHSAGEPSPQFRYPIEDLIHHEQYDMQKYDTGPQLLDHLKTIRSGHKSKDK